MGTKALVTVVSLVGFVACGARSEVVLGTGQIDSAMSQWCVSQSEQQAATLILVTNTRYDQYVAEDMKCSGNGTDILGLVPNVEQLFPSILTKPGTYAIGPLTEPPTMVAGASCEPGTQCESATSGTITVTSVTSTRAEGSYTLDFGGVTKSGTFTAAVCGFPGCG